MLDPGETTCHLQTEGSPRGGFIGGGAMARERDKKKENIQDGK
jgi:hypothetical protein